MTRLQQSVGQLVLAACILTMISACTTAPSKVVENHTLILVVDDPRASLQELRAIATNMGGFVDDPSIAFSAIEVAPLTVYQATLTMRVPTPYLQQTITRIQDQAAETAQYHAARQDFTLQYALLQGRRAEIERSRGELLTLIDERRTESQDTILANDLLHSLEAELHSIEARMQQLEADSALSYIFVELMPIELRQLVAPDS